jgi:two-component system sensor histidine kinase RegB
MTEDARQLADALAATELVLERQQHLSQLDGLAAAAAHELGTPLATITLVAKELALALPPSSEHAEDVRLLNEQAKRCRSILSKLTELSSGEPFDRMRISTLLEEVVAPHRHFGVAVNVLPEASTGPEPLASRNPAILHGLGNIVENAVEFARERVEVKADWNVDEIKLAISDDGPGFASEIIERIGEPYLRRQRPTRENVDDEGTPLSGLGLGLFIAKTLLERSGATLEFANRESPDQGAIVRLRWERTAFEGQVGGEAQREPA